eukprot:21420-Prymnesium_polylepis.1
MATRAATATTATTQVRSLARDLQFPAKLGSAFSPRFRPRRLGAQVGRRLRSAQALVAARGGPAPADGLHRTRAHRVDADAKDRAAQPGAAGGRRRAGARAVGGRPVRRGPGKSRSNRFQTASAFSPRSNTLLSYKAALTCAGVLACFTTLR